MTNDTLLWAHSMHCAIFWPSELPLFESSSFDELCKQHGTIDQVQGVPSSDLTQPPHRDAVWGKVRKKI